jgi:4-amino-4-deoxy-L-arabinose transferase-like glycosyltransferase
VFQIIPPLLALLLGTALRIHGLAQDARLHPDEALYNTYARDAAIQGDWLFNRPLDKPPLMLYANTLSMTFVAVQVNADGVLDFPSVRIGEFAGRLPNTLVGIALVAVVYALAKCLYRDSGVALIAMLLTALSPFAVAFSPTAFTDVFMTFWMVMALWLATCDRWGTAGMCLALGLASKQPAPLYLPVILMVGAIVLYPSPQSPPRTQRGDFSCAKPVMDRLIRFGAAFAVGVMILLLWDAMRDQPSIWQVSAARENYPSRWARPDEILPRLEAWLGYAQWLIGAGWITAILSLLALVAIGARIHRVLQDHHVLIDAALLAHVLGYGLLHWLVAFNTFDRYLLPLLPLVALLVARGVRWLGNQVAWWRDGPVWLPGGRAHWPSPTIRGFILSLWGTLVLMVLVFPALDASEGRVGVGGDLGQHDGIDQVADYLNDKPVATVVYDHWLGWELAYYMGPWTDKRRVYYPTPELLVQDAVKLHEIGPRYFPAPVDAPITAWLDALDDAGFAPQPVFTTDRFVVYALTPP